MKSTEIINLYFSGATCVVDLKNISSKARDYFFREKNTTSKQKYALLSNLLESVSDPVKRVVSACKALSESSTQKLKWNVKRSMKQLLTHGEKYLDSVKLFIKTGKAKKNKRLASYT